MCVNSVLVFPTILGPRIAEKFKMKKLKENIRLICTNEYISSNYRTSSNLSTRNVGHVKLIWLKVAQMINLTNCRWKLPNKCVKL